MLNKSACCVALVLVLQPWTAFAQNPVEIDGDKYKLVMENAQVRVLEYKDLPGEKTHQHRHPAFVLYAVNAFKRKIHLPDGKVLLREFKAGDVMYSPEQVHIGENVGTTPTHVIMVELKTPVQP
ncbi:MAG: cytoplasmic protein [Betaproteobacteria bacterium]